MPLSLYVHSLPKLQWLLFILLALFSLHSFADDSLLKNATPDHVQIHYFDDATQSLSIEDITSALFAARFNPHQSADNLVIGQHKTYWIRVDISPSIDAAKYLLLDNIFLHDVDAVEVYQVSATGIQSILRNPQHTFPVFQLTAQDSQSSTLYLRVNNPAAFRIELPIALLSEDAMQQKIKYKYILGGGMLFGFLTLLLYNLFLFLSVKDKSYLLLIGLFISSIFLLNRSVNTLDFLSLFRDLDAYFFSLPFALLLIFDIAFWKHAIHLKSSHPKANTFFNGLIIFNMLCIPFLGLSALFELFLFIESFLLLILIPGYTISIALAGSMIARLFLPGLIISLLTISPIVLAGLGWTLANTFIIATYMVGIFLFGLSLSLIQAFHIQELRRKNEQAEAMNMAKDTFLATMNHELRTPMHAISSAIDLLDASSLTPEQKTYVEKLRLSSQHMLDLTSDILNLSKAGKEQETLKYTTFSLDNFLKSIKSLIEDSVKEKGLTLNISNNAVIRKRQIVGDETRLKQVLINLLQNAIKFTHDGHISLTIDVLQRKKRSVRLRFSVCDTGIGINKTQQPILFEPFYQVDQGKTRQYPGTGLGLTISQKLVSLMGGNIQLESEENVGSRFYFDLSFDLKKVGEKNTLTSLSKPSGHSQDSVAHILLVDDEPINLLLVRELLSKNGWQVTAVDSAYKAFDVLKTDPIDIVLMDVSMPGMDGYEATQHIRAQQQFTHLPIIALTAHTLKGEKERCFAAGMNDYVSKPFEIAQLNHTISSWLNSSATAKPKSSSA